MSESCDDDAYMQDVRAADEYLNNHLLMMGLKDFLRDPDVWKTAEINSSTMDELKKAINTPSPLAPQVN